MAGSAEKDAINRSFQGVFGARLCGDPLVVERRDVPGTDSKDYDLEIGWNCMREQVNVALSQASVEGNLGTTDLICHVTDVPESCRYESQRASAALGPTFGQLSSGGSPAAFAWST